MNMNISSIKRFLLCSFFILGCQLASAQDPSYQIYLQFSQQNDSPGQNYNLSPTDFESFKNMSANGAFEKFPQYNNVYIYLEAIDFLYSNKKDKNIKKGGDVGNGGNPVAMEFTQIGLKMLDTIQSSPDNYEDLDVGQLLQSMMQTKVFVVNFNLCLLDELDCSSDIAFAAKNYVINDSLNVILINYDKWQNLPPDQKISLVIHEYMGLTGQEQGIYYYSSLLARQMNRGRSSKQPVDILWVIDNSGSMGPAQQNIIDISSLFMNELLKKNIDWKMGLVSTSISENPYLGFSNSFTNKTRDAKETFKNAVLSLGINGDAIERPMLSALNNLYRFPRFSRPNSKLVVIIVTDEAEQSFDSMFLTELFSKDPAVFNYMNMISKHYYNFPYDPNYSVDPNEKTFTMSGTSFLQHLQQITGHQLDSIQVNTFLAGANLPDTDPTKKLYYTCSIPNDMGLDYASSSFKEAVVASKGNVINLCNDKLKENLLKTMSSF